MCCGLVLCQTYNVFVVHTESASSYLGGTHCLDVKRVCVWYVVHDLQTRREYIWECSFAVVVTRIPIEKKPRGVAKAQAKRCCVHCCHYVWFPLRDATACGVFAMTTRSYLSCVVCCRGCQVSWVDPCVKERVTPRGTSYRDSVTARTLAACIRVRGGFLGVSAPFRPDTDPLEGETWKQNVY